MLDLTDCSPFHVAYDALATEMILSSLSSFPPSVEWHEQFEELDQVTRTLLRGIDAQIQRFTDLEFWPDEEERLRRLTMVFFDCHLGFQQRQHDDGVCESLIREPWQRRSRKYRTYRPTGRKILCTYAGSIDFSMRLNIYWVSKVIEKISLAEGKTPQHLIRELGEFLQSLHGLENVPPDTIAELLRECEMPDAIRTPTDLLKAIFGYIMITNSGHDWASKIDICNDSIEDMWDLVDLMKEIVKDTGGLKSLGGAAATGARDLAALGEPDAHLLVPFVSARLLNLLDQKVKILWYDVNPDVRIVELDECRRSELERSEQPETHNFVVEFSAGPPIVYCPCCGGSVTPIRTDRLIVRNRLVYYLPRGRVDRGATQKNAVRLKVNGLFGFDSSITGSLSRDDRRNLAEQAAAKDYQILFLSGLQSLESTAHETAEEELGRFRGPGRETKVHIEVSGEKNLGWLARMIPRCVCSVSMGEELDSLFQAVKEEELEGESDLEMESERQRVKDLEADLRSKPRGYRKAILALEVARSLDLARMYVHDVDMDIIVRKGKLSEEEVSREIQADLIAKWVVLRRSMSRGQISRSQDRDTMTQVKEEGLTVLLETAQAMGEKLDPGQPTNAGLRLALYGAYCPDYERTIILVPVRWVYGRMQDQLRVTGGGDTSSLIYVMQAM